MKKNDAAPSPELVFLGRRTDEPYTTSDIIAEHTGNSYRSIHRKGAISNHILANGVGKEALDKRI